MKHPQDEFDEETRASANREPQDEVANQEPMADDVNTGEVETAESAAGDVSADSAATNEGEGDVEVTRTPVDVPVVESDVESSVDEPVDEPADEPADSAEETEPLATADGTAESEPVVAEEGVSDEDAAEIGSSEAESTEDGVMDTEPASEPHSDQPGPGQEMSEPAESVETGTEQIEPETKQDSPTPEQPASRFDDTPLARELSEITRRRRALAAEELPLPSKTRVFTVANQKGGVGKTTTTVNLAAALARNGARVLVIDLDPQGNSSTALGIEHRSETVSVYDVIINDVAMNEVVQKSPEFDALYCIPATIHLAGAEIELVSLVAREQRLRTALERFLEESAEPFHYVFIDCPPSLGLLTINAFVAASEVLIPIQCEYYALEGLSQLLTNIQLIERHLNPHLAVSTILLTMYDGRTNLANQVAQDVREHFPDQVLSTLIPRSVRISEAPSYGQSVISYDASSPGSLSYLEAAAEIARRGAPN